MSARSALAAVEPDATYRRAYVVGGKRSRGKGSAFRVHARAFRSGLDERLQSADRGSLGRRRRQPDPGFRERVSSRAARSDPLARNAGYRSSPAGDAHNSNRISVGEGFIEGLPRPGGNITGFITSEAAICSKMLDLLLEIAPDITRAAMVFNPDTAPGRGNYYLGDFETAARSSKVEPIAASAQSDAEIEAVVTSLGRAPGGGLIVMPDFFMRSHLRTILLQTARNNVPTIYPWRYVVTTEGGLISYGPDLRDIVRRAAPYVDRILRGAKPADLPVQVPVKFEMALNVKTAEVLGLTVPASLLLRADEVIE